MARRSVRELILKVSEKGVTATRKSVAGLTGEHQKLSKILPVVGKSATVAFAAAAAAATAATVATAGFTASVVMTGAELEQYRIKLNTVLRDTEKANNTLDYLVEFGQRTPFELPGLIEASIQLEAFGLNTAAVMQTVGDTAAAMGANVLDAAMAVTQGMTGEMEMLKRFTITSAQITEHLGHAIDRKTIKGQQEATIAILEVMQQKFGGGMIEMSKSWGGIMSNMSDWWWKLKSDIAEGGIFETVRDDASALLDVMNRFADEGGMAALTEGFNRAFGHLHTALFAPVITDLENMQFNMGNLASYIEIVGIEATKLAMIPLRLKNLFDVETSKVLMAQIERMEQRKLVLESQLTGAFVGPPAYLGRMGGGPTMETGGNIFGGGKDTGGGDGDTAATREDFGADLDLYLAEYHEPRMEAEQRRVDHHVELLGVERDADLRSFEWKMQKASEFTRFNEQLTAGMFSRLYRFKYMFVDKTLRLDKVASTFAVATAGEAAKAFIDAKTQQAKIDAAHAAASALGMAAYGNFAGAAKMAAAAAGFAAIAGAAEIGKALIDQQVEQRVDNLAGDGQLTGEIDREYTTSGSGTTSRRIARTEQAVQNFYITITNNVGGDYVISDGDLTDADQIQDLFDQGLVTV